MTMLSGPVASGPVAWMTGEYPRATDTFIQREIAALRARGVEVLTASIRPTDLAHHVGPEQRAEHAATFHVQPVAKNPLRLAAAHLRVFARSPRRWLAGALLGLRAGAPGLKGFFWQLFYIAEAGVAADWLQRRGVVHLHNHFGNSSCSVAMIASAMSGVPYSYTLHGPMELFEPMRWRIDLKIARARFVACISFFARSQGMLFSDPAHWGKLRVVHCGVDPALYDALPRPAGERLLFVGRIDRIKGLRVLFEAFARLRAERPAATLTLVGDGPDRAAMTAEAAARGLGEAVTFTGYLSQAEVARRLAEADLFVLPSFAEGVPVVLMEALAARVPVVASRVAGVGELVEDGVSGLLVPPGDVDSLAAALSTLLADPERRRRMGEAGRAKVVAEFDARTEAARLLSLLQGAAGAAPRPDPAAHSPSGR